MEGTDFTYIFTRYLPHSYFNSSLPFPYSAMWFGHDCQTTWQNTEIDTEQFRNLQESGRCDTYVSGKKKNNYFMLTDIMNPHTIYDLPPLARVAVLGTSRSKVKKGVFQYTAQQ